MIDILFFSPHGQIGQTKIKQKKGNGFRDAAMNTARLMANFMIVKDCLSCSHIYLQ